MEFPRGFPFADSDAAGNEFAISGDEVHLRLQQRPIQRFIEVEAQRFDAGIGGGGEFPAGGVGLRDVGRGATEWVTNCFAERDTGLRFPFARDFEFELLAGHQDGAFIDVEVHFRFLAAGMQPKCDLASVGRPKFRLAKGAGYFGVGSPQQAQVTEDITLFHRFGKEDVELEVV